MSAQTDAAGRFRFRSALSSRSRESQICRKTGARRRVDESSDDILTRPLGIEPPKARRRFVLAGHAGTLVAGLAGGSLVALVVALALLGDPHGGEPRATAAIEIREAIPAGETVASAAGAGKPGANLSSARDVEQASGVTVHRPEGAAAPEGPVIIRVPDAPQVRLAAAPDPRIVERGRHGPMPRLGEGRLRPLDVYARPDAEGGNGPRIAILVSGLGVGQSATVAAIARLPSAVSLGIAPYGADLEKTAARARDAGHEIFLLAPMEPFDYPDSDPGPQTLLASSRPPENLDRLAWAMSRFTGYVGVVNFMGARLTSDAAAFEPVLKEIGTRGLGYFDDGTSPRSLTATLAARAKVPAARADLVLDAQPRPEAIDRELAKLEELARKKGLALASGAALPMTIDRIARWAEGLEARGIRLVPVSAALRAAGTGTRLSSAAP